MKGLRDAAPLLGVDDDAFLNTCADVARVLRAATGEHGDIEIHVATNRITVGDDVAFKSEAKENNVAFDLFRQGLRRVVFKPGLSDDEVHTFVVRFAECRSADQIDEDFVTTLWREQLPNIQYIALDGFTEKIFMSEQAFVAAFEGAILDVMPGLLEMAEDDEGDREPRPIETLDDAGAAGRIDTLTIRMRKQLEQEAPPVVERLNATDAADAYDHTLHLLCSLAAKHPSPLTVEELQDLLVRLLVSYLDLKEWQRFADALRTVRGLVEAADGFADAQVAIRLRELYEALAGGALLEPLAEHLDPEQTDFTAWCRWHFVTAKLLKAPELLQAINRVRNRAGVDFLKDLLRRQGTESLDPWAERLRDPNPGVVLEVLEVILGSDLGPQARPLFLETLRHDAAEVRAKAVEGLSGDYDLSVREALLPLLKDPSPQVRRAIVARFVLFNDRSVSPYLASAVRSSQFYEFEEDEQRLYFEALARLGGSRFLDVFREMLQLEDDDGGLMSRFLKREKSAIADNPTRRAAISGLAAMGGPAAKDAENLIRTVRRKADLSLGSHCDVTLKLAQRGEGGGAAEAADVTGPKPRAPLADVSVGQGRMGERQLFAPSLLQVTPPARPSPKALDPVAAAVAERPAPARAEPLPAEPTVPAAAPSPITGMTGPIDGIEPPLLREGEHFLAADRRRLRAEPGDLSGGRFRLTGIRAALVGPPEARSSARATSPPRAVLPVRVVEKQSTGSGEDFSHSPDATLDDILMSYLSAAERPAPEPGPPTRPAQPIPAFETPKMSAPVLGAATPAPDTASLGPAPTPPPRPSTAPPSVVPAVAFDPIPHAVDEDPFALPVGTPVPVQAENETPAQPPPLPPPLPSEAEEEKGDEEEKNPSSSLDSLLQDFLTDE